MSDLRSPKAFAVVLAVVLVSASRPAFARPTPYRALVEEGIALSAGAVWYWLTPTRQLADWDYPSWEQRFTFEAWRFDNNTFATNYLWHAFGGTEFHLVGRANGLPLGTSVALGFGTSFIWEYLLEFREKVSINDVLYTTGAGIASGEFFHWLGLYLTSSPRPSHPLRILARWTLGHAYALHQTLDGSWAPADAPTDRLGFTPDIWHRFRLSWGLVDAGDVRAHEVRAEGDLAALPGYLAPGHFSRFFRDGNVGHVRYRGTFDGEDIDTDFLADTTLFGLHTQDIGRDGTGHATTVGAGLAYRYRRERLGDFSDRLGLLHLGDLALDEQVLGRGFRLAATLRLHLDFAGIESAAYPAWKEAHADAVEKTILRKQGYYYGWGVSARLGVELTAEPVAVGFAVFTGRYDSQEGLDRNQEEVTFDVDAHDRVDDQEAWLRVGPVLDVAFAEARWLRQARTSRAGGHEARQSLERLTFSVGAQF